MCGGGGGAIHYVSAEKAAMQTQHQWREDTVAPEALIAGALRRELGVIVNEQALRIFIRKEWRALSVAAHKIHNAT